MIFETDTIGKGYRDLAQFVMKNGAKVSPRGQCTHEILDALIIADSPSDTIPTGWGRNAVPAIGIVEALQLIAGRSDPTLTVAVAPNMAQFMDRDVFWGAYGNRQQHGEQIMHAVRKLRNDRDTRQAVVTLWDPVLDNVQGKKDYPCTISLIFTIRGDRLNLHVTMRSNDIWWGLAYDAYQFTQVQFSVAQALGIEVGQYRHHAVSLHAYERDFNKIEDLRSTRLDTPRFSWTGLGTPDERNWYEIQRRARQILRGQDPRNSTVHERIMLDALRPAFEKLERTT